MNEIITLTYRLTTREDSSSAKCQIYLNGKCIGSGNSAAYDGARLLLKMGYGPDQLMTTRSFQSKHASWKPKPISHWAKLRVVETDTRAACTKSFREWTRVDHLAA